MSVIPPITIEKVFKAKRLGQNPENPAIFESVAWQKLENPAPMW